MTALVVDRGCDLHTHSNLTDGNASPEEMCAAACSAGLHTWGLSDHVRRESTWVDDYARRVRGLRQEGLTIRCGVEAKILDADGRLDLPGALPTLDYVLIADHQFPSPGGPVHPAEVGRQLDDGTTSASAILDVLVAATCRAVSGSPFRPIVVHLFSLLPKIGLSEELVQPHHHRDIAGACREAGAAVEVNEKWRCPGEHTLAALAAFGVDLVAGSDAHRVEDIGSCTYLDALSSSQPSTVR